MTCAGAGAWACAAAKLVASNLSSPELEDQFEPALRIWMREEQLPDGRKLTEVFNETRENEKCAAGLLAAETFRDRRLTHELFHEAWR